MTKAAAVLLVCWTCAAQEQENPFGLMLGAKSMPIERRIALVKELGVLYFRPNSLVLSEWKGTNHECDAALKAGLKLVLTIRNDGGTKNPTNPPVDIEKFKKTVGEVLEKYKPEVLVVENEENSSLFYNGSAYDYAKELAAACSVAHDKALKCTNGGPVSKLVCLLVYDKYVTSGEKKKADLFASRVFEERERSLLGNEKVKEQIEKGKEFLKVYKDSKIDYVNFHWYVPDPEALAEAAAYLKEVTGKPLITNEFGLHEDDADAVKKVMSKIVELKIPYALYFSIDAPQARALVDADGNLRSTGKAFKEFVGSTFKK